MKKLKIFFVTLIPIIIGISGCYIFTAELLSLFRYGLEGGVAAGYYAFHYVFMFITFVIAVESFAAYYVLTSIRNYRYKIWAFVLFLLFPVFLLIIPFVIAIFFKQS